MIKVLWYEPRKAGGVGGTRTLDRNVNLGTPLSRFTLPVVRIDAVAERPVGVGRTDKWARGRRLVWSEEARFVEGASPVIALEKFVDPSNLQGEIVDPLLEIESPDVRFGLHEFQGDEALLPPQRGDIHLLLDRVATGGEVIVDVGATLIHALFDAVAVALDFVGETCFHLM